ncbi:MAG: hypothetical protein QOG91_611 [Candidatus Parcubacteria bacterium]|jgi:DNA polymerase III delta subunit|nr:hypothetical protein [Candidatus Parcubacteria bacterium]
MLYVFYGSDIRTSREKAHKLIDSLRAKKPDAAYEMMSAENWNGSALEGHLGGQGLFSHKYIVFLDRLTENAEAKEKLPEIVPALHESANIFIILEGKVNAELKKMLEKNAEKSVLSEESAAAGLARKRDFNIFALGDALGSRDSLKAWMIFRQARDSGLESENILGTLFWQVKSMVLSATAKTAGEAGVNPFIFSKSKSYAANYSPEQLKALITDIITLYHDGHRGLRDLELATERLLLNCGKPSL